MAKFIDYRANSRVPWGRKIDSGDTLKDRDDIKLGCLLRIADAAEAMAKSHVQLQNSLDFYKHRVERLDAEVQRLLRSNAALRGVIKRRKKESANG